MEEWIIMGTGFLWGGSEGNVLELDCGDGCTNM